MDVEPSDHSREALDDVFAARDRRARGCSPDPDVCSGQHPGVPRARKMRESPTLGSAPELPLGVPGSGQSVRMPGHSRFRWPWQPIALENSVAVDRPIEFVARFMSDQSNARLWMSEPSSVEWKTAPPLRQGSKLECVHEAMGESPLRRGVGSGRRRLPRAPPGMLLNTYAHLMPADHERARSAVQAAFTRAAEDSVRTAAGS